MTSSFRGMNPSSDDSAGGPTGFPAEDDLDELAAEAGRILGQDEDQQPAEPDSYWNISRTPLTSLVFSLPLVVAYEGGVLLMGPGSRRNGADVWLRQLLDACGLTSYFLLPGLTVLGLLAWHHVEHDRWRVRPGILAGMAAECGFWAAMLVGLARLQSRLWPLVAGEGGDGFLARLVGFCGAGLYEEVLFRLLLLPVAVWCCRRLVDSDAAAAAGGLLLSSVLFSAAHYVGPLGDTFEVYSFVFRVVAGMFFGLLFVARGFGITAGTHALYDVLVGLL